MDYNEKRRRSFVKFVFQLTVLVLLVLFFIIVILVLKMDANESADLDFKEMCTELEDQPYFVMFEGRC